MDKLIFIIEDDPMNMKLIVDLLHMKGYQTLQAENGDSVEQLVKTHNPDLILADIRLPGISGLEITRTLKSNPDTKHVPIILTTAFTQDGPRSVCMESGCNGYLAKPYSIDDLYDTVDRFMPQECMAVG